MEIAGVTNALSELFLNCIEENQLNIYLQASTNLTTLQALLQLKSHLIYQNKHSSFDFPLHDILKSSASGIDEICRTVQLALTVQRSNVQYKLLLKHISDHLNGDKTDDIVSTLKLLNVVLTITKLKNIQEYALPVYIYNDICNVLNANSEVATNFLVNYIFPKIFDIDTSNTKQIIDAIWHKILNSNDLHLLCAAFQCIVPSDTSSTYSLVNTKQFWTLLQERVASNDSMTRKQALYLLQLAINSIKDKPSFIIDSKLIFWNVDTKTETLNAWQNLFVLFEISNEKQLHLIEPAYQLISTINILDASWLLCVYKIFLSHPHSAVCIFVVFSVLKGCWWYEDLNIFKPLTSCLLSALNKTECVQNRELWGTFDEFLNKLDQEKLLILLEESATVAWIPPVCYLFYNSFCNRTNYDMECDLIEKIVRNICKLPHKFIRTACVRLLENYVNRKLQERIISFQDFLTMNCSLSQLETFNSGRYLEEVKARIVSWSNSTSAVDLREIQIIVNIMMESCKLEDNYVTEHVFEPYLERKFSTEISDRLGPFVCKKGKAEFAIDYINYRLLNLKLNDEVCIDNIKGALNHNADNMETLNKNCVDILLERYSNVNQQELAFEIVTALSTDPDKYNPPGLDINNIETRWKKIVLQSNAKLSPKLSLSFLKLYNFIKFNKCREFTLQDQIEAINIFENLLETQTDAIAPEIFKQLEQLINRSVLVEKAYDFVDVCLQKLNELKRSDIFKVAIDYFTKSIFCNAKIHGGCQYAIGKSINIALKLLEFAKFYDDTAVSLANHLCCTLRDNKSIICPFIPILVELLLFGEILKKDQRAEYDVCQLIQQNSNEWKFENNPNYKRIFIRARIISLMDETLKAHDVKNETKICIADTAASSLMDKYRSHFKKRYFANSNIHLQKLRVLQALLVIHNHISSTTETLINLLVDSLCLESHQISIKLLIQWLLIRLLRGDDKATELITSKINFTSKVHSSTIIAFIPILYHLALHRNDEKSWNKLYEIMLPWTMGAHFNLRLYAQEGLQKIYTTAIGGDFRNLLHKFEVTFNCISEVLEATQRQIDFVDKFVFDAFNPTEHLCLGVIYFDVPKMTNLTHEEYENVINFELFNTNSELHQVFYRELDGTSQGHSSHFHDNQIIQKKINPFTYSFRDDDQRKTTDLIVIASLIDKSPNLGGLSRTCEIFGVKRLILNSINIVKDHEFQSISMSSENWVDIAEVKTANVRKFLLDFKEMGYSIIGCEQTSNSHKLDSYKFPQKTALLLGNEKEGISPDLLSAVDVCVEIPQFGVVRSLNVHVAAAVFIWEYTKQHAIRNS